MQRIPQKFIVYLYGLSVILSFLQGCGAISTASDGEAALPGVYMDSTLNDHLKKEFEELKVCTGLHTGEFEDVTVVIMPPKFECRWHGGACSGEFSPPNTIKLGSPYVWKHEAIHYLLYLNTGYADSSHQSSLFQACI